MGNQYNADPGYGKTIPHGGDEEPIQCGPWMWQYDPVRWWLGTNTMRTLDMAIRCRTVVMGNQYNADPRYSSTMPYGGDGEPMQCGPWIWQYDPVRWWWGTNAMRTLDMAIRSRTVVMGNQYNADPGYGNTIRYGGDGEPIQCGPWIWQYDPVRWWWGTNAMRTLDMAIRSRTVVMGNQCNADPGYGNTIPYGGDWEPIQCGPWIWQYDPVWWWLVTNTMRTLDMAVRSRTVVMGNQCNADPGYGNTIPYGGDGKPMQCGSWMWQYDPVRWWWGTNTMWTLDVAIRSRTVVMGNQYNADPGYGNTMPYGGDGELIQCGPWIWQYDAVRWWWGTNTMRPWIWQYDAVQWWWGTNTMRTLDMAIRCRTVVMGNQYNADPGYGNTIPYGGDGEPMQCGPWMWQYDPVRWWWGTNTMRPWIWQYDPVRWWWGTNTMRTVDMAIRCRTVVMGNQYNADPGYGSTIPCGGDGEPIQCGPWIWQNDPYGGDGKPIQCDPGYGSTIPYGGDGEPIQCGPWIWQYDPVRWWWGTNAMRTLDMAVRSRTVVMGNQYNADPGYGSTMPYGGDGEPIQCDPGYGSTIPYGGDGEPIQCGPWIWQDDPARWWWGTNTMRTLDMALRSRTVVMGNQCNADPGCGNTIPYGGDGEPIQCGPWIWQYDPVRWWWGTNAMRTLDMAVRSRTVVMGNQCNADPGCGNTIPYGGDGEPLQYNADPGCGNTIPYGGDGEPIQCGPWIVWQQNSTIRYLQLVICSLFTAGYRLQHIGHNNTTFTRFAILSTMYNQVYLMQRWIYVCILGVH